MSTFPKRPRIYRATLWGGRFSLPRDSKDIGLVKRQIEHYSKLQLAEESDRLNAILGIFRSCEKMAIPIYHYRGIPIRPDPKMGPVSRIWTISLLDGFLWMHYRPCRRLTKFPSWTWLGWSGDPRWFIPDVGEVVGGVEICLMDTWVELAGEE